MPRDGGFTNADVDVRYFADPKLKRLWHLLQDPALMSQAVTLHLATVFESWATGNRVTVDAATPVWLVPPRELLDALRQAGLLDDAGKLPAKSWRSWFQPAVSRRDSASDRGRAGGLKKAANRLAQLQPGSSSASDTASSATEIPSSALPVRPSYPSVITDRPSSPSGPAGSGRATGQKTERTRGGLEPVKDLFPPLGSGKPAA